MTTFRSESFLAAFALTTLCLANSLDFQGMKATYNGNGRMRFGEPPADYMIVLNIQNTTADLATGSLTITPDDQKDRNIVFIDSINVEGSLSSINITFPPGRTTPCYVRNIHVSGNLGQLTVDGGDLGAPDGQDGQVSVGGRIDTISVNGKKYSYTIGGAGPTYSEWWGGNTWADIYAGGAIQNIKSKGGDFYYDQNGGILGTISLRGDLGKFFVQGTEIKTNSSDKTSEIYRGGNINANILGSPFTTINSIETKGGLISDGLITCLQLKKILTTGQKPTDPFFMPVSSQGLSKVYVVAADVESDGHLSDFTTFTVKNGSIRDSMFAIKGDIGTVSITSSGGSTNQTCLISNVIMRAGFEGDLSVSNFAPTIYPSWLVTTVFASTRLVIPFAITGQTNEELTIRTHYRDNAVYSVISNVAGQTFWGTNRWRTTDMAVTGFFVWATETNTEVFCSNVIIRARDNGVPNKYCDFRMAINVVTALPVVLVVDPSDNPRTNAAGYFRTAWSLSVVEPRNHGPIAYQVSGLSAIELEIQVTNLDSQTAYAYTGREPLPAGTYTDIVFSANNGVFWDKKNITLVLTSIVKSASAPAEEWQESPPESLPVSTVTPAHTATVAKSVAKWTGAYKGDFTKLSTVGHVVDSKFIASTADEPPFAWSNAYFYGHFKNVTIKGLSISNTFVSKKKITVWKPSTFDYTNNYMWVDGLRVMTKNHDYDP